MIVKLLLMAFLMVPLAHSQWEVDPVITWPVNDSLDPLDPLYDTKYDQWHIGEVEKRAQDPQFLARYPLKLALTESLIENVGRKVLHNETSCKPMAMVHWNIGEPFPSLGIGHAIWFPRNVSPGFQESFPNLMKFIRARISEGGRATMPDWLDVDDVGPAPWGDRDEFLDPPIHLVGKKQALTNFLSRSEVLRLQMAFLVNRVEVGILKILADAEWKGEFVEAQAIYRNFLDLSSTGFGIRAMVDYTNFKGEGLRWIERTYFNKYQWGLKQVLNLMSEKKSKDVYNSYADAVEVMLHRIVVNVAPERREQAKKWLPGWMNRVSRTYRDGNLDQPPCPFLDDMLNSN